MFLGTNQPQEDASWIFQLRMAELERAKSGRTSEPRPWQRLARAAVRLRDLGPRAGAAAVRAARRRRACPSRCCVLARPSAARAGADHRHLDSDRGAADRVAADDARQVAVRLLSCSSRSPMPTRGATCGRSSIARCDARSALWWEGIGCGFPLLAPVLIAVAYEKLAQNQETDWDFAPGLPGHARPAGRAQHGHRRVRTRGDARGSTASPGTSRWPSRSRGRRRRVDAVAAVAWQSLVRRAASAACGRPDSAAPPRGSPRRCHPGAPAARGRGACGRAARSIPTLAARVRRAARRASPALSAEGPRTAARRQLRGGRSSCAGPGPTSTSPTRTRGVASAAPPGARLRTRTRSTPSARRSSTTRPTARSTRRSSAASRASSPTSCKRNRQ